MIQKHDCAELFYRYQTFAACKNKSYLHNPDFQAREHSQIPLAHSLDYLYINNMALLCPDGTVDSCTTFANGEPVSYDRHHRSLGFSRYAGKLMLETYEEQLQAIGFPSVKKTHP